METLQRHNLRQNHITLVDDLDPRAIIDDLFEDEVLTENDCDRIKACNTRKEQCRLLLTLLPTRGPAAYGSFLKSLTVNHDHLANLLKCSVQHMKKGSECSQVEYGNMPPVYSYIAGDSRKCSETETQVDAADLIKGDLVEACSKCSPDIPKFAFPQLEVVIKNNCCLILENVEAKDLLDIHYQEYVFGDEECERIKSGKTRSERCIIFISELSKRTSNKVMSVFTRSLEKKYGYIIKEIKKTSFCATSNVLSTPTVADIHQPIDAEFPRSIGDVIRRPILAEVLHRGITACVAYPGKLSSSVDCQPQSLHFNDKQLESINSTQYGDTLADDDNHSLPKEQTSPFDRFKSLTNVSPPKSSFKFSQERHKDSEDVEWMVRRNRHLKRERKLFDRRSQQVFPGYEDNVPDNRLHGSCPTVLVNETKTNVCLQKQSFETDWKEEETDETHAALVGDVDNAPCRRKREQIRSVSEHQPSTSKSLRTDFFSNKGTENIQMDNKLSDNVYPITTNSYNCRRKASESPKQQSESEKRRDLPNLSNLSALTCNPGSMEPHELRTRRLEVAFNALSTMINQGHFEKFERFSVNIKLKYVHDFDMMCILDYLHASRDLFIADVDSAKKHINTGLQRVAKTSNPKYFTLELFSAQTRMYLSQKKLQKLENTLADAKMIIETDPVGCSGRAAGWLYMNDVRDISCQLVMLNVHRPNYTAVYKYLHGKAVNSCKRALDNFNRDGGKDGPFGIGFALCRLAILLLRCGDNGLTMDVQQPDIDDIEMAGNYLRQLEDSDIAIPKILEVHYLIAKCDLQYRRSNSVRALEHAEAAYRLATEINMLEFTEHAHNRGVFLRSMPVFSKAVGEEEVSRILFDDSADSFDESAEEYP
ncbi:uncharacterized protein LOC110457563 [Mizuhopecten yessoensis]|uniref:Caspase-2 n=1 Tax=Mizuhopecten yessoensis TaxID=6573 RepID=A0A210Q8E0_MIZYE|nr:uncharacterized protein LOC110457563 [Mizuhopecten yessoensis]OWF44991.1 Caspase-2 [Mizuhopecten yessoensis]